MATKIDMKTIAILGLIAVLVLAGTGYLTLNQTGLSVTDQTQTTPTDTTGAPTDGLTPTEIMSAKGQWLINDALTQTATASGDTGYVSIVVADDNGVFNFLVSSEETEYDAAPDTSARTYSSGQSLVLAVSSDNDPTSGEETYPRWFYISSLKHNAEIRAFDLANPIQALKGQKVGTTYKYTVTESMLGETVGKVTWLSGTTPYWDFGVFEVYGRVAKASIIEQFTSGGVVLTTFNDGATWEDTVAEINANHTMTSDKEDINFQLIAEANDVAFGLPYLGVSANGEVSQYNTVLVITTSALGINAQELYNDGWQPINKPDLTADLGFYYVLTTEGVPNRGDKFSIDVPITIEDSGLAASTKFQLEGWALDSQKEANVARGSTTTSLPGANGFITEFGLDTVVQPLAMTVSSGSAATMQLLAQFTTNA
ncbi:MAG: hypothetical protein KJ674_05680 [Nanoarchaeota archaeon]|nr:hypothetical protein [Nanoarchaeota archaeon]